MRQLSFSRTALFATAALGGLLLAGSAALAQVRIFEQAPSIEQLRSIMIPESRGSASRSIVLLRPDAMPRTNAVQAAMVQPSEPAPAAQPVTQWAQPAIQLTQPVVQAVQTNPAPVAAEPVRPAMTAAKAVQVAAKMAPRPEMQASGSDAGIVGFRINFALDSATLPSNAYAFIDRMAELMQQEPQVKLQVEGHTAALGSAEYNQGLSERRAAAVA